MIHERTLHFIFKNFGIASVSFAGHVMTQIIQQRVSKKKTFNKIFIHGSLVNGSIK